jgi:hypothetical protein
MVCIGTVGVQLQRTLELGLRSSPIPPVVENQSQRSMSFSGLRLGFDGLERYLGKPQAQVAASGVLRRLATSYRSPS